MIARRLSPILTPILTLCCTALLVACGAGHEWSQANQANSIAAYQKFLSQYPNDPHAVEAQRRIAALQDEQAWTAAQIASTAQGYQQYLTSEPNGTHAQAAHDEITARERDAAWTAAQANATAQSLQDFINKYPSSAEASQASDKLKAIAGYRAEIGSARSQRLADRERDALAKRFSKQLQNLAVLEPDANNHDYRITSAPMSEQAANSACQALRQASHSCKVVQVGSSSEALRANRS